jgi:type I restriction enzyme S subunit
MSFEEANLFRTGDVVVIRTGYPGTAAVIPPHLNNSNCADLVIITPSDLLNPHMLAAVFNSAWGRSTVGGQLVGSAQQHFNIGSAKALRIRLPGRDDQDRIADILCALTELMENLQHRIELLDQMMRAIYREWFTRFRYPNHEEVPLVESDLGRIPRDWAIGRIDDVAEVVRGRSYKKSEIVESGGVPFLNLKCINRGGGFRKSGLKRYVGPYKPIQVARPTEIVVAVTDMTQERNVVARAARVPSLPDEFGVISLDLVKVVPTAVSSPYLYGLLGYSSFPHQVKNFANGANVLHLHPDRIGEYRFVCPPRSLQMRYSEIVDPMYDLTDRLELQVENLRVTRDLLVPRLVSGKIDVSKLELDGLVKSV